MTVGVGQLAVLVAVLVFGLTMGTGVFVRVLKSHGRCFERHHPESAEVQTSWSPPKASNHSMALVVTTTTTTGLMSTMRMLTTMGGTMMWMRVSAVAVRAAERV